MEKLERRRRERYAFFVACVHSVSSYPARISPNTINKSLAKKVNIQFIFMVFPTN